MRSVNIGFDRTISHYKRICPLSFTNYSQVFIVYDIEARVRRVMKVIPKDECSGIQYSEQSITSIMQHPNVVRLLEGFDWKDYEIMILPKYDGGSLRDAVVKGKFQSIHTVTLIAFRLLLGLNHIHARSVLHGDISPNNVLFDNDSPVIIDFGGADAISDGSFSASDVGTPGFCAPERKQKKSGLPADIFSMGATICYLLEGNSSMAMVDGLWREAPLSLRRLVSEMMHEDSACRPTVNACLEHACFAEILGLEGIAEEMDREARMCASLYQSAKSSSDDSDNAMRE